MGTERQTTPQSITVEYIVTEELDGTTLAPEIIIDQTAADKTTFDTKAQIYRPKSVPKLGLIDPDLLVGGSIGARCIPFFSLDTDQVAAPGAALDIVGVREDESTFFQKLIESYAGAGPFFNDAGFNVPQGSDMRIGGFSVPPNGALIRVRLTILVPATCLDIAAFRCPCPDGGEPCCPPVLSPLAFIDAGPQIPGWAVQQVNNVDSPFFFLDYDGSSGPNPILRLGVDKVDPANRPTVEILEDPLFPVGGTIPTAVVDNVTVGANQIPEVRIEFDLTDTTDGPYYVRLQQPCGCCTGFAVRFTGPE